MGNSKDNKPIIDNPKRKSIKTIATGASVAAGAAYLAPKAWKKPVVDSIILPAHAQTTATTTSAPSTEPPPTEPPPTQPPPTEPPPTQPPPTQPPPTEPPPTQPPPTEPPP